MGCGCRISSPAMRPGTLNLHLPHCGPVAMRRDMVRLELMMVFTDSPVHCLILSDHRLRYSSSYSGEGECPKRREAASRRALR